MNITQWATLASDRLLGRRITGVRYMTDRERNDLAWDCRALVLELDDGSQVIPSADCEGNAPGALFIVSHKGYETLPPY